MVSLLGNFPIFFLTALTLPTKTSPQYRLYPKIKLLALRISGKSLEIQILQKKLQVLLQILGEQPQKVRTNHFLDNDFFMLHYKTWIHVLQM